MASAEAAPYAKVGGLGDVLASLPRALREFQVDVRLVIPAYGFIDRDHYGLESCFQFNVEDRRGVMDVEVFRHVNQGVIHYFLATWPFFGSDDSVYSVRDWDIPRFIIFNHIVMSFLDELVFHEDWRADVLHVHDWHMALSPFLVQNKRRVSEWNNLRSVLSIHNLDYQGADAGGWYWDRGIPARQTAMFTEPQQENNQLAIGIAYADFITTVSTTYAKDIQTKEKGQGLDALLRQRGDSLHGILNGIDMENYNPRLDDALLSPFDADNFVEHRPPNKRWLQKSAGLLESDDTFLIGMVSRLVWEKGVDLAIPALRALLTDSKVQFVALGVGDPQLEFALQQLADDFAWKAQVQLAFDEAYAQQIYAGCDAFLMPSRIEPCGIGQLIAMRYGALPIVRETGGLKDTVIHYDEKAGNGNGFVFQELSSSAIEQCLRRALSVFEEQPNVWQSLQKHAILGDFSWRRSAHQIANLYHQYAKGTS